MKIKKVVSSRVVKRVKGMTIAALLIGCVTFMTDWSVKDIFTKMDELDTDMSEYGIFVNADEDQIETGETQLRQLAEV